MKTAARAGSKLLALICVLAGFVALSYALEGIESLRHYRENPLRVVGFLVPAVLCASAWYMAGRLLKSAPKGAQPECLKK